MQEGFAAEDAEKRVSVPLGVGDGVVERLQVDGVLFLDVNPTALTAEVAGIDDREIEERREVFAAFDPALELLDRDHPPDAEIPEKLPEQSRVRRAQDAKSEGRKHH